MSTGRMGTRYATAGGDRHGVGVLMDYNRGRKRIATGSPLDRPSSCEKKSTIIQLPISILCAGSRFPRDNRYKA